MAFGVTSAFPWAISIGVATLGHRVCMCPCSFQFTLPPTIHKSSSCNTSLAKLGIASPDATLPVSSVSGCWPTLQVSDCASLHSLHASMSKFLNINQSPPHRISFSSSPLLFLINFTRGLLIFWSFHKINFVDPFYCVFLFYFIKLCLHLHYFYHLIFFGFSLF